MGLIDECSEYFGCETLYEVLSIDKNATDSEIKKAYRKSSLLLHPDKVKESEKEVATKKFQTLSKVHYILSDPERRAFYDETGTVDGDCINDESPDYWSEYWRALFPKITVQDIDKFMKEYTGSDEELKDLKECYLKYEGNMDFISDAFIGYKVEEEDRIRNIINDWIEKEEVPAFPKFVNEKPAKKSSRIKKAEKERAEATELSSLSNAMAKRARERESDFNSLLSRLTEKYGSGKPQGKKTKKVKK